MSNSTHIILALCMGVLIGLTSCTKEDDLTIPNNQSQEIGKYETKAGKSNINKLVAQVRQATVQYHDYQAALDDGFFNTEDCVSNPDGEGAMGVHFVRFDRLDDVHNPLEPEVLVYELRNNGTYKLVAVEYLHVGDTAPMFGGEVEFHPFSLPFADYELHLWLWKANPDGQFTDWNPNVSCPTE
ncbi:hypothetical protein [Neolewinella litorea]|uniref:Uncharacterized protein n=1 Tax=Neolewinella litorea TaxID=2562452 RepID=A0A4S4NNK0_9BACT|nr:hypothetical protein [Neolewinella litorea]THH41432.1 hypothetical protein E4021_02200 [Neolewinella litorea]